MKNKSQWLVLVPSVALLGALVFSGVQSNSERAEIQRIEKENTDAFVAKSVIEFSLEVEAAGGLSRWVEQKEAPLNRCNVQAREFNMHCEVN